VRSLLHPTEVKLFVEGGAKRARKSAISEIRTQTRSLFMNVSIVITKRQKRQVEIAPAM